MEIDYTDEANWAQFKSGEDVSLAIRKCAPDYVEQGSKIVGRFVGVTLMVDDIEDQYNRLVVKGVEFTGRPEKQNWGGTLAHLKDLDGNVLTLMQEAD
jgi:lactoylglutathione lyase